MSLADVLNDQVAQELLTSATLARLAYSWTDGTPRVVPIWFHWTGTEVVMGTFPRAPKLKALGSGAPVALTIDGTSFPYRVLLLRGLAVVTHADGVTPEYAQAAVRYFGPEQGKAWVEQVKAMNLGGMARISVVPTYARILDFQTRFPSALSG